MKNWMFSLLVVCALGGVFAGCQLNPPDGFPALNEVLVLRSGTSFGECLGYCRTELELDARQMVLIRRGWDRGMLPDRLYEREIEAAQWEMLVRLIDLDALQEMDEVYGCPDCADGGAEWFEVETEHLRKKVTFEYGDTLEPAAGLIKALRAVREAYLEEVADTP